MSDVHGEGSVGEDLVFLEENHSVFQAEAVIGSCVYAAPVTFGPFWLNITKSFWR